MSCVVVDNLESLIDYGPIGPRYSNLTLQTLLVLLKKQPPKGKRLLIICTTSRKDVLNQMEMLSAFTDVLHVSNLGKAEHIERVIETDPGFSPQERQTIRSNFSLINFIRFLSFGQILSGFVLFCNCRILFNLSILSNFVRILRNLLSGFFVHFVHLSGFFSDFLSNSSF